MALGDLTSHQAVLVAIAEFDRLGRDAFLAKYGFGRSRAYFVIHDDRPYDSKAIAGAAHGFQFPDQGPLEAASFSGGEATVRKRLEGLGFTVKRVNPAASARGSGYWVFVCNPKKWAIDRFLERGENQADTWGVRPSDSDWFAPGQLAIVRVGIDRRSAEELQGRRRLEAGIYAICQIESPAAPRSGASDRFWAPGEEPASGWPTVEVTYVRSFLRRPLTISALRAVEPGLSPLLLDGFQGSSFPISEDEFLRVVELLGEDPEALGGGSMEPFDTAAAIARAEEKYRNAAPKVRERVSRHIERGSVGNQVKKANGFKCLVCEALGGNPIGFLKPDSEPYVEAHHVMPVAKGEVGSLAASNVMTVCANHHRQLHYGGVTVEIHDRRFELHMPEGKIEVPRFSSGVP
jgi:predicted RNA-binding protein with PUA-like domain